MTDLNDLDGYQALDHNQLLNRLQFAVSSGCAVSPGTNDLTVQCASGEVYFDGSAVSVSAQDNVALQAADSTRPRKDVVYVDGSGTLSVAKGDPEEATPVGETGRSTYRPSPPDLSATDAVVLAEVWVSAGASDIASGDVTDRRVFADAAFKNLTAQTTSTDEAIVGELDNIPRLDNSDPDRPNVDDYLTNQLSDGEAVYISPGTHTVTEITPGFKNYTIYQAGTLEPSGDHPVFTTADSANLMKVIPVSLTRFIDTTNIGSSYTSDAFNVHQRIESKGAIRVSATGRRAVNMEQVDTSNHTFSNADFRLEGNGECEVGLMIDNPSGAAVNLNAMNITVEKARNFTAFGCFANAGIGNVYEFKTGSSDVGTAWYAGGGPRGFGSAAGDTTNRDHQVEIFSDASNTNSDESGDGIQHIEFEGVAKGNNLGRGLPTVDYKEGNRSSYFSTGEEIGDSAYNGGATNQYRSIGRRLTNGNNLDVDVALRGDDLFVIRFNGTDVFSVDMNGEVNALGTFNGGQSSI